MPYLGNEPAVAYTSTTKDSFSGDGSTTDFTMSKAANVNAVRVVVENVVQNPTVAYTCSGTTLSFTSAPPTGTNNIYVVHLGPPAATIAPPTTINNATTFTGGLTFKNGSPEDTDGGRESILTFKGVQSGEEESTLALIQAAHDGTSDDEKGLISFRTNDGNDSNSPTERWRITSDGHFKAMVNGYGIDFSATEGSAAQSSILDDFEEGSFNPIFSGARPGGGDVTVNTQLGRYTKVGNIVHISLVLGVNGSTVDANNSAEVTITGLPYTIVNIASQNFVPISMFPQSGWNQSSATQGYTNLLHNNTTNIVFYGIVTSASTNFNSVQYNQLGRANSNDSLMVRLNGVYRVAT